MARRKSTWSRRLDGKRLAFEALRRLTDGSPRLRRALSFYPELADLPDRILTVARDDAYRIRLAEPRFRPALAEIALDDWDVRRPEIVLQDDFMSRIFIGTVAGIEVPGHTLAPLDPGTSLQASFALTGLTNWNFARPGLPRLVTRRLAEPAIVLPPHRNYWHLLIEHLLPLIEAWRLGAWTGPLVVVTGRDRPPLLDATLAGLAQEGADIRIETPGPFTTFALDRMLVAANHSSNAEHSYALPGAIPAARGVFEAAYRDRPARSWGRRIYVTRRNAKLRRLANEAEILAGLERRGFEVLEARWDNHPDQIAAFSEAEIVVGPHGAGLTNVVFSRAGTALVELFPFDHRKSAMLHLAAEHDLRHRAVFGSPEGRDQAFGVDPDAVLAAVDAMLAGEGGSSA